MKLNKSFIALAIASINVVTLNAQTIINGDFENNTGQICDYNLINTDFNLKMPGAFGFGAGNELDIMSTCPPFCDSAEHGNWYIAVANSSGTAPDELSLTLSSPLIAGKLYTLSFWDHGETSGAYPPTPVQIGVSLTNNSTGTVIYTGPIPTVGVWTNRIVNFVAPINAQYITVAATTTQWAQLDNFEFLSVANFQNSCFGDTTNFTISNTSLLAGVQWDFNDTASGLNNISSVFNPSHYFTSPGTYNVQIIEYLLTGNTDTIYTSVTIYPYPVFSLGNDTTLCTGNPLLLSVDTGLTSYLWQDGSTASSISVNNSGTYFVVVNNNGCSSTDSIDVIFTICSTPIITFAASDTSFCEKTCLDFFDLSTNSPTSWQWYFPGASPDTSTFQNPTGICYNSYGNFNVTLIACNGSGCDSLTISQFINEFQNPVDSIWSSNDTLWSLPFPSYQWYEVSGGIIVGATNQYFVPSQLGSYYCVVDDTIGCVATSNTITLTGLTPGPSPNGEGGVVITPNPNDGNFEIIFNAEMLYFSPIGGRGAECSILNPLGQVVFASKLLTPAVKLSLHFSDGIYVFRLISDDKIMNQKFVVHH